MASEAADVKLPGMLEPTSTRRRSSETLREADRLSRVVAINLGRAVKAGRLRLGLHQKQLAARVDVTQAWISRIELGHGDRVPLRTWLALGVALKQPIAISFTRPLDQLRGAADAGHLAMQEQLLELARATGRRATFELPTRPANPWHSIDVCLRDPRHRVLVIQEVWNTFGDIGASIRSTNRKAVEAADLAATIDDDPPFRVAVVWIVRPSAGNRAIIGRYPQIFRSAFPGSSRLWVKALADGGRPPDQHGLVWLDPMSGRPTEWRRAV